MSLKYPSLFVRCISSVVLIISLSTMLMALSLGSLLPLSVGMGALPVAAAATILKEIQTSVSLDPISLITLFFDSAEKDLLDRTGDMTLLACCGLFVNPTTTWYHYHPPHALNGLRYYNPKAKITSTIEVLQVNSFLVALAAPLKETGVVVWVKPIPRRLWLPEIFSFEWMVIRPIALSILVCVAGLSRDLLAIAAIGALLIGQSIAICKTIKDGKVRSEGRISGQQTNIFFLPENVTFIVKCQGGLFVDAMSSSRSRTPSFLRTLTTLTFMGGILLVGLTGVNFKIAFLLVHALQATLLGRDWKSSKSHIVNGALWEVDEKSATPIHRRREAYVWASTMAGAGTQWLKDWDLAAGDTLSYVEEEVAKPACREVEEGRSPYGGLKENSDALQADHSYASQSTLAVDTGSSFPSANISKYILSLGSAGQTKDL